MVQITALSLSPPPPSLALWPPTRVMLGLSWRERSPGPAKPLDCGPAQTLSVGKVSEKASPFTKDFKAIYSRLSLCSSSGSMWGPSKYQEWAGVAVWVFCRLHGNLQVQRWLLIGWCEFSTLLVQWGVV